MDLRAGEHFLSLSGATDLAHGYEIGTSKQICDLSLFIAKELNLNENDQLTVFYTSLLRFIGCTGFSSEEADIFKGDDIDFKKKFTLADPEDNTSNIKVLLGTLKNDPIHLLKTVFSMQNFYANLVTADCETASFLAAKMNLPSETVSALSQIHERYDGKGKFKANKKDKIHIAIRIIHVSHLFLISYLTGGINFALSMLKKRSGYQLDPNICDIFRINSTNLVSFIEDQNMTKRLSLFSKQFEETRSQEDIQNIFESYAHVVDLKSRFTNNHSKKMVSHIERAGAVLGYSKHKLKDLKYACLCHNLGISAVPSGLLDKPGSLSHIEKRKMELHPYYTQMILDGNDLFQTFRSAAVNHHEKADGSGYFKG